MRVSTALGRRSMVRMGPVIRATEDPPRRPPTSRHLTSPLTVLRELRRCRLAWRSAPTRSHGGSQGFKSPHLHPQPRRSERRQRRVGGAHCMFRPRCGRKLKPQCSPKASEASRPRPGPHTMTTQRGHRQPPPRWAILARIPASPGRPPGRPGPVLTTSHDDQVQVDPPLAQHGLRQLRAPGSNLGQTTRRHGHRGRPRRSPAIPRRTAAGPPPHPATSFPSDTADAATHRHRTPDTRTLRRPHRTPVTRTGPRRTPDARTGYWTPDAGHERRHG
jgi:hypothetical protein